MLHERVLVSVYRGLCGAAECPPVYGSHWESIGFQGSDPSTDVRGGGLFSLLQLLAFVQAEGRPLALRIFQLSTDPQQHFPFAVVALNISGFVLTALRSGALHGECSRRGDVWAVCHSLFTAAMSRFYQLWRQQSATILCWNAVRESHLHPPLTSTRSSTCAPPC